MRNLFLFTLLLALSLTCFSQEGKWDKAQKKNTIESYQKFLQKYPDSEYSENAQSKIIELEYKVVKNDNTIESYSNFIKKYPKANQTSEATKKLMQLEYIYARENHSISIYKDFLKKYPNASFEDEIRNYIITLEAISNFNAQPNHPDYKNNWRKFRQSFYYNNNVLTNNSAQKAMTDILSKEYNIDYNLLKKIIKQSSKKNIGNNFSTLEKDSKEEYIKEFNVLINRLDSISFTRPINNKNYDILNIYSKFFEIIEELFHSSENLPFVESIGQKVNCEIVLTKFRVYDFKSTTPKIIPFYGRTDEWNSNDISVLEYKNMGLDMLEYHTNKITAKEFGELFSALEEEEKNENLKRRLSYLIIKAKQLSSNK